MSDIPRGPADERAAWSPAVRAGFAEGQAAWPGVVCPSAAFAATVGRAGEAPRYADLYLVAAVLAGEPAAQVALDGLVRAQAQAAAARVDPSPAFADEVAQLVLTRMLVGEGGEAALSRYRGEGPLAAFLRVTARRVALDLVRGGPVLVAAEEQTLAAAAELPMPELGYLQANHRDVLRDALRTAFTGLPREQRQVVRLHYAGGLGGQAIAALVGVDRSTVVRWLAMARAGMLARTRAHLQEALRLPQGELDSLIGVLRSQLDLSVSSLLQTMEEP